MLFSEREGYVDIKIQGNSLNHETRIDLYNCFFNTYKWYPVVFDNMVIKIWCDFLRNFADAFKTQKDALSDIKYFFLRDEWYKIFSFLEFCVVFFPFETTNVSFVEKCNGVLKKELASYRFIKNRIIKIQSDEELFEIEKAINNTHSIKSVNEHLITSLNLLSNRDDPDYRNSIKESISAVEALCKIIAKNKSATLAKALKEIENKNLINLHPALKEAFLKLYGYSSNSDGIRHSLTEETDLDLEDARYFFVSCSAFVNYLMEKSLKAGFDFDDNPV